jgi:hypothetical protein
MDELATERRFTGRDLHALAQSIAELNGRVATLEARANGYDIRLVSIEHAVLEMKSGVSNLVSSFAVHASNEERDRRAIIGWLITTLSAVVGFGVLVLLKAAGIYP